MSSLGTYSVIGINGFLDFLKRHSNTPSDTDQSRNYPIDFVATPSEEVCYPENPFMRGIRDITRKHRQILHICRAEQKGDELSQLFEDRDRFVAEIYTERGIKIPNDEGALPFPLRYEYMRLRLPDALELSQVKTIPVCTIEIQTEFAKPSDITLRRKDTAKRWFFWHTTDLEKTLPNSVFLSIPEMRYTRAPVR